MLSKGFTLLESLIVIMIIAFSCSFFSFNKFSKIASVLHDNKINHNVARYHFDSLIDNKKRCILEAPFYNHVCFNSQGNINKAQTFMLSEKKLVFHLGYGHHEIQ